MFFATGKSTTTAHQIARYFSINAGISSIVGILQLFPASPCDIRGMALPRPGVTIVQIDHNMAKVAVDIPAVNKTFSAFIIYDWARKYQARQSYPHPRIAVQ